MTFENFRFPFVWVDRANFRAHCNEYRILNYTNSSNKSNKSREQARVSNYPTFHIIIYVRTYNTCNDANLSTFRGKCIQCLRTGYDRIGEASGPIRINGSDLRRVNIVISYHRSKTSNRNGVGRVGGCVCSLFSRAFVYNPPTRESFHREILSLR